MNFKKIILADINSKKIIPVNENFRKNIFNR